MTQHSLFKCLFSHSLWTQRELRFWLWCSQPSSCFSSAWVGMEQSLKGAFSRISRRFGAVGGLLEREDSDGTCDWTCVYSTTVRQFFFLSPVKSIYQPPMHVPSPVFALSSPPSHQSAMGVELRVDGRWTCAGDWRRNSQPPLLQQQFDNIEFIVGCQVSSARFFASFNTTKKKPSDFMRFICNLRSTIVSRGNEASWQVRTTGQIDSKHR